MKAIKSNIENYIINNPKTSFGIAFTVIAAIFVTMVLWISSIVTPVLNYIIWG